MTTLTSMFSAIFSTLLGNTLTAAIIARLDQVFALNCYFIEDMMIHRTNPHCWLVDRKVPGTDAHCTFSGRSLAVASDFDGRHSVLVLALKMVT